MKITLTCFGITKEIIGQFSYTIELPEGATVADLKQTLATQFPALKRLTSLRIARNEVYAQDADAWWQRWRIFFMACAELFGFEQGQEWVIGHFLFKKRS